MNLSPDEDNFQGRLLHQAALWYNVELLQELLSSGAVCDARDEHAILLKIASPYAADSKRSRKNCSLWPILTEPQGDTEYTLEEEELTGDVEVMRSQRPGAIPYSTERLQLAAMILTPPASVLLWTRTGHQHHPLPENLPYSGGPLLMRSDLPFISCFLSVFIVIDLSVSRCRGVKYRFV